MFTCLWSFSKAPVHLATRYLQNVKGEFREAELINNLEEKDSLLLLAINESLIGLDLRGEELTQLIYIENLVTGSLISHYPRANIQDVLLWRYANNPVSAKQKNAEIQSYSKFTS